MVFLIIKHFHKPNAVFSKVWSTKNWTACKYNLVHCAHRVRASDEEGGV